MVSRAVTLNREEIIKSWFAACIGYRWTHSGRSARRTLRDGGVQDAHRLGARDVAH